MFKYIKENHRLGLTIWVVSIIAIIVAEIALELKPGRGVLSTMLLAPLQTTIFVVPWLLWIRSRMKKSNHKDASGEGSMKVDEGNERANKANGMGLYGLIRAVLDSIFMGGSIRYHIKKHKSERVKKSPGIIDVGVVVGIIGGFLLWVEEEGMPEGVFEWIASIFVSITVGGAVGFSVAAVIWVLYSIWKKANEGNGDQTAWGLFHGSVLVSWSMPIILLLTIIIIVVQGPEAIPNGFLSFLTLYWFAFIIVFASLLYVLHKWNEAIKYNAIDGKPGRRVWRYNQDDPGYTTYKEEVVLGKIRRTVTGRGNHHDYKKGDISKIKYTWFYNSRDHANERLNTYFKVARIALPCVMLVMYMVMKGA